MADIMVIEGAHRSRSRSRGKGKTMDELDSVLPPELGGFGMSDWAIAQFLPSTDELQNVAISGAGVAGGIVGGLAAERFLSRTVPMIPRGAYPFLHVAAGAVIGKAASGYSPALGIGLAAGWAGLGVMRFLQSYLGIDISLSEALSNADLSNLGDLMAAEDDLLPPELQGLDSVTVESRNMRGLGDNGGMGNTVVEERKVSGYAGYSIG